MSEDLKEKILGRLIKAGVTIHNFVMENNSTMVYNNYGEAEKKKAEPVANEILARGITAVRGNFWGDSAIATIFCVCRDVYGYPDNQSQFERDFGWPEGVISNAFRHNPYMKLPINNWRTNGAMARVLRLMDLYQNTIETELSKAKATD